MKRKKIVCFMMLVIFCCFQLGAKAQSSPLYFEQEYGMIAVNEEPPIVVIVDPIFTVEKMELYINEVKTEASIQQEGNRYQFTKYIDEDLMLGVGKLTVVAYGVDGSKEQIHQEIRFIKILETEIQKCMDFENDLLSSGNFKTQDNSAFDISVKSTVDNDGNPTKAWTIQAIGDANGGSFAAINLSGNGKYRLEADIKLSTEAALQISVHGGTSSLIGRIYEDKVTLYSGSTSIQNAGELTKNPDGSDRWHHIIVEVDTEQNLSNFYLDGTLLAGGGQTTQNSIKDALTIRLQFQNISGEKYGQMDNVSLTKNEVMPYVSGISGTQDTICAELSGAILEESLENNVKVMCKDEEVPVKQYIYDGVSNTLTVEVTHELYTAVGYTLILGKNVANKNGIPIELENRADFVTEPADFDIVNFRFLYEDNKIGAKAEVVNHLEETKSAVMVMVFKNTDGAIEKVLSSEVKNVSIGGMEQLEIAPVESEGRKAEVFFLYDWDTCINIKTYIYK